MKDPNPFISSQANRYSCYIHPEKMGNSAPPSAASGTSKSQHKILEQLKNFIQSETYPCLAAKAAFNTSSYRAGIYPELGSEEASNGLSYDLFEFIREKRKIKRPFTSFLAVFESPVPENELAFEQMLWKQLNLLHQRSSQYFSWNSEVSERPEAADFSFSFAEQAFFIVGMHPEASRLARRFPYPLLVFNPHEQFESLKEQGLYNGMKEQIRKRDKALQGSINPMVEDFGTGSEARQYAGRKVASNWKCPFNK